MSGYVLGIDQSTQGTKAILFDREGRLLHRVDKSHRQIIHEKGWVSHDPEEIYRNTLAAVRQLVQEAGIDKGEIETLGISNQRETSVIWDGAGNPLNHAVVWQCSRAEEIAKRHASAAQTIREKTGLPLSPYFPAAKMAWLLENSPASDSVHLGTMDSWLLYRLTKGVSFKTDYSNASRTQLFNLHTLMWDEELCSLFGISVDMLPQVADSDSLFGYTDFEGFLDAPIPIHAMLGDSHAALFGQGCHQPGMVKATYGTGSSIMMHVGDSFVESRSGLVTSLAWSIGGKAEYVLEGNIHYTGAVITWLKDDMGLIGDPRETEVLAAAANPADTTVLVPAFSGLGAPWWRSDAKAILYGMTRTTGKAEVVKAALESIAFQINDVLTAMEADCGSPIRELRTDGGPAKNRFLMQFQSNISRTRVCCAQTPELSAIGAAYLAGIAAGIYDREQVFSRMSCTCFESSWTPEKRQARLDLWHQAVRHIL